MDKLELPSPRKGTTIDTLLQHITLGINTNDISQVDYTIGGSNNHTLEAVSPIFCDNVILYYDLPLPANKAHLDNHLKSHLPEHTYKIKRILQDIGINVSKGAIKPTNHKILDNAVRQYIKVALQDTPINDVMLLNTNMEMLASNGIFVNDMDLTQDYKGIYNKSQIIEYLVAEHQYGYGEENPESDYHILSNDDTVSLNCLSIMHSTQQCNIRYKLYNKFVQMCESPSVRNAVGNHFADWIHCPERIVRDSISKTVETGLLRIELTFYVDSKPISMDFIQQHISYITNLLPTNLIYHNPIRTQWNLLLAKIHYNMLVIDNTTNRCLFSYYINKVTHKITGFYLDAAKKDLVLKQYSFNLPIRVIEYTTNDNGLFLEQHWYEKVLHPTTDKRIQIDQLTTYLTSSNKEFKSKSSIPTNPNAVGFEDNVICRFRASKKISIANIPIELKEIPSILSLSKYDMGNCCREVELEKEFLSYYQDTINEIRKSNKTIEDQHKQQLIEQHNLEEQIQQIKQQQQSIGNHLTTSLSNKAKRLVELPDKTKYYVYAYRNASVKQTRYLLAVSTEPTINEQTQLDVYVATKHIRNYIDAYEWEGDWYKIAAKVYGRNSGKPIFAIQRNGYIYDKSNNKQPCIELLLEEEDKDIDAEEEDKDAIWELESEIYEVKDNMQSFKHNCLSSKCPKIDDIVKQGDVITVLDTHAYRNTYILSCKVNGNNITCKSNKWMDEMLEGKEYAFHCVASIPRRHPISKRNLMSFVE